MSKKPKPVIESRSTLTEVQKSEESRTDVAARAALRPSALAAVTVQSFCKNVFGEGDVGALMRGIREQCEAVKNGDMTRVEDMLVAQAHSLDAIFASMAQRAALNAGQHIGAADTYLRLAFKAQSQSRATLETLAAIKNPQQTAFIRQQNIAHTQQVNNASAKCEPASARVRARVGDSENPPNKLLAGNHRSEGITHDAQKGLDARTTQSAVGTHPAMATVGAINRPKDASR